MSNVYTFRTKDDAAEMPQPSSDRLSPKGEAVDLDTERRLRLDLRKRDAALENEENIQAERDRAFSGLVAKAATEVVAMRTGVSAAGGKLPEESSFQRAA